MSTLQIVFLALAASLILFWIVLAVLGPRKIELPNVVAVLRYGAVMRLFSLLVALGPPLAMTYVVAALPWKDDQTLALAGGSFLATSVIAGLLLIEVARGQVCVTEEGLTRISAWSRSVTLPWNEVERIRYSSVNNWFVVTGAGRTIRVSRHLAGVKIFAELAKGKLAVERYASAATTLDAIR